MSKKILGVVVALVIVGIGIFMIIKENDLAKKCTVEAVATVVDFKEETNFDDDIGISYTYYPLIEYIVDGTTILGQVSSGSNRPAYNINDKINILYNPNKVDEFIVKNDGSSNFIGIAFIAVGAIVLILSIVSIVKGE